MIKPAVIVGQDWTGSASVYKHKSDAHVCETLHRVSADENTVAAWNSNLTLSFSDPEPTWN